jgi:hypothetical protein
MTHDKDHGCHREQANLETRCDPEMKFSTNHLASLDYILYMPNNQKAKVTLM